MTLNCQSVPYSFISGWVFPSVGFSSHCHFVLFIYGLAYNNQVFSLYLSVSDDICLALYAGDFGDICQENR